MFKRFCVAGAVTLAALSLHAAIAAAADDAAQAHIIRGGHVMRPAEIARLQGARFYGSVEGQRYAQRHGITTTLTSSISYHCYGAVKWKKGYNAFGITLWGEWNHTSWCGRLNHPILRGSVQGYTDTWTGPVWESSDVGWRKWRDPLHPKRSRYTESHAKYGEGGGGYDVSSETVEVTMHIYSSGVWR